MQNEKNKIKENKQILCHIPKADNANLQGF